MSEMDVAMKAGTHLLAWIALICTGALAAGCESAQKAGSLNQAIVDYNAMRYTQAHQKAVAVQEKAAAGEKEDAAYVAGLSAYQLGQFDDAEKRLWTATRSSNPQTAARARVMLGQLRMDQYRPRDAATLFAEAAPDLEGEEARKCAYNAAVAAQQAGDLASARRWSAESGGSAGSYSSTGSPTLAAPVARATAPASHASSHSPSSISTPQPQPVPGGGFTLQVGAFRDKKLAQQAADDAQRLASQHGLSSVRIISRRDERGAMLYVVQFGRFPTRDAAATTRSKLGKLNYIVAPITAN